MSMSARCGDECNCWKLGEQRNCITFHGTCWDIWGSPENWIKKQGDGGEDDAEGQEVEVNGGDKEEVKAEEGTP